MPVATIKDISNPWRDAFQPANFRNAPFFVEAASRENGRRMVVHQFPKKDIPYAEDMGRQAISFTVRAYVIAYPFDDGGSYPLRQRDYRPARDLLRDVLDSGQYGTLQLPFMPPMVVACERYRLTEEDRFGGYCTFDITFVEFGIQPNQPTEDVRSVLLQAANNLTQHQKDLLADPPAPPGTGSTEFGTGGG